MLCTQAASSPIKKTESVVNMAVGGSVQLTCKTFNITYSTVGYWTVHSCALCTLRRRCVHSVLYLWGVQHLSSVLSKPQTPLNALKPVTKQYFN